MNEEAKKRTSTTESMVTVAIAVVSLLTAVLGVYAGLRSMEIARSQNRAVAATINREQVNVVAHTWMFQDLRAFVEYQRLNTLASITESEAQLVRSLGNHNRAQMTMEQSLQYRAEANAKATFFAAEYILPDGTFDEGRFLANQIRFGSRNLDTNPKHYFEQANLLIQRNDVLENGVYIFTIVISLLIFAKVSEKWWCYLWIGIAALILAANIIYIVRAGFSFNIFS